MQRSQVLGQGHIAHRLRPLLHCPRRKPRSPLVLNWARVHPHKPCKCQQTRPAQTGTLHSLSRSKTAAFRPHMARNSSRQHCAYSGRKVDRKGSLRLPHWRLAAVQAGTFRNCRCHCTTRSCMLSKQFADCLAQFLLGTPDMTRHGRPFRWHMQRSAAGRALAGSHPRSSGSGRPIHQIFSPAGNLGTCAGCTRPHTSG